MDPAFYIPPEDLTPLLGTAQMPDIIDVCVSEDVQADPFRLPGAQRVPHGNIDAIVAAPHHASDIVVVCQKGLKLSLGVAAHLRAAGLGARALSGGVLGWSAAGLPRMSETAAHPAYALPSPSDFNSLMAAWVIRRWIAPGASLLWVPGGSVAAVAERFDAVPIDPEDGPTQVLAQAALDWPPLTDFAAQRDAEWTRLLDALPRLHAGPEAVENAALPIIDAAWSALRSDLS